MPRLPEGQEESRYSPEQGHLGGERGTASSLPEQEHLGLSMKRESIHPALQKCIGTYEGLRRLGFQPDDIYMGVLGGWAIIRISSEGKTYQFNVHPCDLREQIFSAMYERLCSEMAAGRISNDDWQAMYEDSLPFKDSARFMLGLLSSGIRVPNIKTT